MMTSPGTVTVRSLTTPKPGGPKRKRLLSGRRGCQAGAMSCDSET